MSLTNDGTVLYCPECGSLRPECGSLRGDPTKACCPDSGSRRHVSRKIAEQAQLGFNLNIKAYQVGTEHGKAFEKAQRKSVERCPTPDVIFLPFCPVVEIKTKSPRIISFVDKGQDINLVKMLETIFGLVEKPQDPLVWPIKSSDRWSNSCRNRCHLDGECLHPAINYTEKVSGGLASHSGSCCDKFCPLGFKVKNG